MRKIGFKTLTLFFALFFTTKSFSYKNPITKLSFDSGYLQDSERAFWNFGQEVDGVVSFGFDSLSSTFLGDFFITRALLGGVFYWQWNRHEYGFFVANHELGHGSRFYSAGGTTIYRWANEEWLDNIFSIWIRGFTRYNEGAQATSTTGYFQTYGPDTDYVIAAAGMNNSQLYAESLIKDRITRWLVKKGFASKTNSEAATEFHTLEQQGFFTDTEAIIDTLQAASIQSRLATGPNTGKKVRKLGQQIHLPFYSEFKSPRCFAVDGYSLHANTFCHENESYKLRRLIEYVARPPFANDRIALTRNGDVTLKLKKPFNDGTTHIVFTPLEFVEKLSALVPKPRVHLIRYAGAFARHAKIRSEVLVKARLGNGTEGDNSQKPAEPKSPTENSRNWARLLRKVFNIDVDSCHNCGGKNVKIIAAVMAKQAIVKILNHVGIPTDIPEISAARAPPQAFFDW